VKRSVVHELSIAQSLLEIVLEESARNRLKQVHVIRLQVGAMAAVVPEALNFCFDLLSENTLARGASLEIETLPVVARCSRCELPFQVENQTFLCPKCGDPTLELVSGRELSVVSIEGETGDRDDSDDRARGAQHSAGQ
jgi:hydrogenase nickel incorporation protein HypA/HybF